ncbi:Glyoxalase/Bleomycin resistance protein/Dihydroxybiphenyl dioxygenase [Panaeolus papilionaceus]|nr:Glyoxalase/Bleomycin resistance protein/Dihydroxybiphenyl dioxygenase [Panaeolus papilionaceus]
MPLDHIGVHVSNLEDSLNFYKTALKPLGYKVKMTFADGQVVGMGSGYVPDFWVSGPGTPSADGSNVRNPPPPDAPIREMTGPMHIAFTAKNRRAVRDFYNAAISTGAKCNGPPGVRPEYCAVYYGAFVLDPDGRNIEAVCIKPAFIAEEWGVVGWISFGTVLGVVVGGIARYFGHI